MFSPPVRRRRLALALQSLIAQSGMSQREIAAALGWSPRKITEIVTNQWRRPAFQDVSALLDLLGVEGDLYDRAMLLVEQARQRGWWTAYDLPADHATYLAMEAEASVLRVVSPLVIPGPLQTVDYSKQLLRSHCRAPEKVTNWLRAHERRCSRLLDGDKPVTMHIVVWEAALRCHVGGDTTIMAEQLEHLLKLISRENITFQVIPFSAGPPPFDGQATIVTLRDPLDPEVIQVPSPTGEVLVDDEESIAALTAEFEQAVQMGETQERSRQLVESLLG